MRISTALLDISPSTMEGEDEMDNRSDISCAKIECLARVAGEVDREREREEEREELRDPKVRLL